jgi:subtilisin family serine protease
LQTDHGVHADKAWSRGFTGKGVTVFVLDDGVQSENADIAVNYVSTKANAMATLA